MQIEVRTNGETESIQTFPPGRVIVGRSPDNEIYIKSKFVSRHHLQLVCDQGKCVIEDLNSTNGVYIGEAQINKRELASGDIISLGVHELVYTYIGNGQTAATDKEVDLGDTHDNVPSVIDDRPQSAGGDGG